MKRLSSDLLRIIAICAVMLIHATAGAELLFAKNRQFLSAEFAATLLNQFARFSVPVFIMLSGYGLAKSYSQYANRSLQFPYSNFMKSRLSKIILPYLLVSLIFMLTQGRVHLSDITGSLKGAVLALLFGEADYHLYFITIIVQCYLLFPLLLRFQKAAITVSLFILQFILFYPVNLSIGAIGIDFSFPPAVFSIYWLFYFNLAIYIASNEDRIMAHLSFHRGKLLLAGGVAFFTVMADYSFRSETEPYPDYYNHFNRNTIQLYSIIFFLAWLAYGKELEKRVTGKGVVRLLAPLTFTVYLFHTILLRLLLRTPLASFPLLIAVTLIIIMFATALLLYRTLPAPVARLIGLPVRESSNNRWRHS